MVGAPETLTNEVTSLSSGISVHEPKSLLAKMASRREPNRLLFMLFLVVAISSLTITKLVILTWTPIGIKK